jgi:chemotaxis protein MotB
LVLNERNQKCVKHAVRFNSGSVVDGLDQGPEQRRSEGVSNRQKMREVEMAASAKIVLCILTGGFFCHLAGCGYSQEEWDQKVRENSALTQQLAAQRQASEKCTADFGAATTELDALKRQFQERGVSLDNMSNDLEQQRQANEEYRKRAEQLEQVRQRFELLQQKLKKLTELGLKVQVRDNRMLIQLPGNVLFDSGRDALKASGLEILGQVAAVLRADSDLSSREFQVAGHTDNKPLAGGSYKDNWGLSAMRARSVLAYLTAPSGREGGGLDPTHWSAAGYADTDPVASNETEEGREQNRRVELVVLPNVNEMLNLNSLATR